MADTIVNTPGSSNNPQTADAGGWAVAIIVLLVVLIAGFLFFRRTAVVPQAPNTGTDINVTLPSGGAGGAGDASDSAGSPQVAQ